MAISSRWPPGYTQFGQYSVELASKLDGVVLSVTDGASNTRQLTAKHPAEKKTEEEKENKLV